MPRPCWSCLTFCRSTNSRREPRRCRRTRRRWEGLGFWRRSREPVLGARFLLRAIAALLSAMLPAQAAVFSDDPNILHDPRHAQSRMGADKVFAPIGLFRTDRPVLHQEGATTTPYLDVATAFLLSPC